MAEQHTLRVIARIHSDFPTKFGIPRQSGLVEELRSAVVFEPEDRNPDALLGVLAQDPRPTYQHDPDRVYGLAFGGWEVKFTVAEDVLTVREIFHRRQEP